MPHDIALFEDAELNSVHSLQHPHRIHQAALARVRKIDLRDVAGDDRLRVVAHACQEHLHLLDRCVLRLIHDDECVIQRASAHERDRSDFDRPFL